MKAGIEHPIADHCVHRRDHAGLNSSFTKDLKQQVAGRRLPIRTRNAYQRERPGGKTVPCRGKLRQCYARIRYTDKPNINLLRNDFTYDDPCTLLHSVGDIVVTVIVLPAHSDKKRVRDHLARIGGQCRNVNFRQTAVFCIC